MDVPQNPQKQRETNKPMDVPQNRPSFSLKQFNMFMTDESTMALKPYLFIEDSKATEYSNLLALTIGNYLGGKNLSIALEHEKAAS